MAFSYRRWWWLVWLWPISTATPADTDDRAVMKTVLEHFAARRDANFYDDTAILAISPRTQETRGPDSYYRYLNQGDGNCAIPESLYLSLRKRNSTTVAATQLAAKSLLWRVVDVEEANARSPGWPRPGSMELEPVKTLVTLTKPGFSTDGDLAFVNLSFAWSIRSAEAQYLVKRAGSTWEVTCSHLIFYV